MKGTFQYKNKAYRLIDEIGHKNKETGEWDAVALYTDGKNMYTRDLGDFYSKFTEIPQFKFNSEEYKKVIEQLGK